VLVGFDHQFTGDKISPVRQSGGLSNMICHRGVPIAW
jgi:hypothetical protein